ncbi:mitochondrial K+-H+ exchange-related-domain-containing protein [Flagelloscypha sp. PMI_526]|nr:mitochondrial K+-H+ exchange-related-domain-containing protein [Flagelloscypha sp. PMI_526]
MALPRTAVRIIALPLTRPRKPNTLPLTFYHFHLKSQERLNAPKTRIASLVSWGSGKLANTWASFGKGPEGTWRTKLYAYGEQLFDRLEFEELVLKNLDTSLAPVLPPPAEKGTALTIPLIHPTSLQPEVQLSRLRSMVDHRIPTHKRGFWRYLIIAPFTAPFMIIPVIPNLPFFYCAWRSWHHWRAYKAAEYIKTLLDNNNIIPQESQELDVIYKDFAPSSTVKSSNDSQRHDLLLSKDAVPAIVSLFNLAAEEGDSMYRALAQAKPRATKGKV